MSARVTDTFENPDNGMRAVVRYSRDFEEYDVRFFRDGVELVDSRYFTSDHVDATGTAKASIGLPPARCGYHVAPNACNLPNVAGIRVPDCAACTMGTEQAMAARAARRHHGTARNNEDR